MTFKVEFFIDDKQLGEAFKRLTGLAKNVSYNHVANLEKTSDIQANGQANLTATESLELFVKELRKIGKDHVRAPDAREAMKALGYAPTSYSYFLKRALKQGLMKRQGGTNQTMTYSFKKE
jgi:hypothetical protein